MNDRMDMVQIQRDELKLVLGELYDKLSHGVYNHIFPKKSHRRPDMDPDSKCKKGKTRRDVQWCMGRCCVGCEPIGKCHLSLEEYDVFKAMNKAYKTLKKQPAEMPVVRPEDFPPYDPCMAYRPTPRWIARQFYRFSVGYWLFANHSDKEQEKDWERAYNDLLSISLGRENGRLFRKFLDEATRITDRKEAQKWVEDNPDVDELFGKAGESVSKGVEGEKDIETFVLHALALRMDYNFGHDYPGGDMDVYDGVFTGLIDNCLKIAGLYPDDRPKSYDFDDKEEYEHKYLMFEHEQKNRIYSFMLETDGLETEVCAK